MRKRHLMAAMLILVSFLAASNAYATQQPTQPPQSKFFVAADLTRASSGDILASEFFVVLQAAAPVTAAAPPNRLLGTLFIFNPVTSCGVAGPVEIAVSGGLFTNPTTGAQTLNFTGYVPPDPCIKLGALVNITIGPLRYYPPDPCVLTFKVDGRTITFTGETARFLLVTTTTTSSTTTPPT